RRVTGAAKNSIAELSSGNYDVERALAAKRTDGALAAVRAPTELADVSYVRQDQPRGLGHAVLCAADRVGDEPFAVLLGDDLISAGDHLLDRMIEARRRLGGSILALMEAPAYPVSPYGLAGCEPTRSPPAASRRSSRPTTRTSSPSRAWSRSPIRMRRHPTGS